ncbi:hypothetical protein [Micromonospora sp. NPDC047074]|uniref:hypothetical protein n=1 Tax=Micromonospora sp. NPDC047074 TaxID=3154339 RepID=UPI0033FB30AA
MGQVDSAEPRPGRCDEQAVTDQPDWTTAVRAVHVRHGTQTSCGGIAVVLADVEPHPAYAFVARFGGEPPGPADLRGECVEGFADGIRTELARLCGGQPPPVRVVLRRILVHEVDSSAAVNRAAGRRAAAEAVRRAAEGRRTQSSRHLPPD